MYDVITFGSATQDIHIKSEAFKILGKDICLPLGAKIDVQDVVFTSGGGGTNTAATFAKQDIKTAFCGAVGADLAGREILRELRNLKIVTRFALEKKGKKTNQSIIIASNEPDISGRAQDRTILAYRGASDSMSEKDIDWDKIKKTKWFYLAPFAAPKLASEGGLFAQLVDFAWQNGIKIAVNPSKQQLEMPKNVLWEILHKADILFLNKEEAELLPGGPREFCSGIVVMTKGGAGADVFFGQDHYFASPNPDRRVVDATGAGDAFASGFLSEYIRTSSVEKSIQYGMANSEANLAQVGAKTGLLKKGDKFNPVPVTKT